MPVTSLGSASLGTERRRGRAERTGVGVRSARPVEAREVRGKGGARFGAHSCDCAICVRPLINGLCFSKAALNDVGADTPKLANIPQACDLVNTVLRGFGAAGRVVMLGWDIGARVFPGRPFKFFLNAPRKVLEQRQMETTGVPCADKRIHADRGNALLAEKALEIDPAKNQALTFCEMILAEIHRRAAPGAEASG